MSDSIQGNAKVWLSKSGEERRIYVSISGLPGWLLGMLETAGPLTISGTTYDGRETDGSGPSHIQLCGSKVFAPAEPSGPAHEGGAK